MVGIRRRFAVNVAMNWVATAVNMVVPFFLTPFVVRHLGALQYGIWILAVSIVSYLALLDLGLRSAVIRFVSKAEGAGKSEDATAVIHAAFWFRLLIGLGVAVLAMLLAFLAPHLFKIPSELMLAARVTVLLCGIGVSVTLISGVFGAVLAAIHRFDLLSTVTMCQTIARACGVLLILRSGRGLISMAFWELAVITAAGGLTCIIALKKLPAARPRMSRPDSSVLRTLWSYSLTTFVFMIAVQIIINTDSLVIGACLSLSMVTFYSIGSSLVSYATQVAGAVSSTFTPIASNLEASGRSNELEGMLLRGTQAMLGLALPIAIALTFRGGTFISIWMGPQYGVVSEMVLRILMISLFFSMGDATAGSIMMAIDKHKPMTRWAVYEAVLNLGLSIVLAKKVGLYGVAWGTSISMAFTHLAFWPRYVRGTLHTPIKTYLWQGWGRIVLASVPFAITCAVAEHFWHPRSLPVFFAQILVTLPVYAIGVLVVFRNESKKIISEVVARWNRRSANAAA
jgi:O-antigen/teichoic acid export membrane protein